MATLLKPALRFAVASIWLINGAYCKVLMQVPRHREIVATILGSTHADVLTRLIGLSEIGMAIWILSGRFRKTCGIVQIILIAVMNTLEMLLAPHLLLFGWRNGLLALLLIAVIAFAFLMPRRLPVPQS